MHLCVMDVVVRVYNWATNHDFPDHAIYQSQLRSIRRSSDATDQLALEVKVPLARITATNAVEQREQGLSNILQR